MGSNPSYETRFAHTHILGGSGHGKTQLLQSLIYRDLSQQEGTAPSVVVIDSQGDLINTISQLALFDPLAAESLHERFLLIDPANFTAPPAINLFDANLDRIKQYGAVEQERIKNGTIELYEYFFGALLGAGLSQKQNLIFRYLAELMLTIDGANIHTLRELLETPDAFQDDIAKLDGTARLFFEQQFFDKSYDDTRTQVARRLWGILANRSFERIFSSRTSRIDLFDAMNTGKVILINTAKDLLKQDGTAIFGRFFIAMIAQAALERAQIPREQRRPTFVYIDEAQDYFDENIDHMLEQVRKYKIGLVLAHQTLAQLTPKLKASIMANTGTKILGGLSHADASALAREIGCSADFLQSMRKDKERTQFALWVKGDAGRARSMSVELGAVDRLPRMDKASYQALIDLNAAQYGLQPEATPTHEPAVETPETEERDPSHRDIQEDIRALGHQYGYHVSIEHPVLDGTGRIDVVLEQDTGSIAIEIGRTTQPHHEVANVQKCLDAEFQTVWHASPTAHQRDHLRLLAEREIGKDALAGVRFVLVDELPDLIAGQAPGRQSSSDVRGYQVEVTWAPVPAATQTRVRHRIGEILTLHHS